MRENLKKIEGVRATFHATFSRFGRKAGFKGNVVVTCLLSDVTDVHGNKMTDHLWFVYGKNFSQAGLKPGDKIQFDARSVSYKKGYRGNRHDFDMPAPSVDFRLGLPTKVKLREQFGLVGLPLFETQKSG